jgi:putative endonuclease
MQYYVYILASAFHGTLYVGVTNDLIRRIWEHKQGAAEGFTKKHDIKLLVYYEIHSSIEEAIKREKSIKRWGREMKYEAIQKENPYWHDLYKTLI